MKYALIFLFVPIAFWGCNSGNQSNEGGGVATEEMQTGSGDESFEVVHLSQDGFDLNIAIPADYRKGNELTAEFDPSFGHMIVQCGEVYKLQITQEKGSFQGLLEDLESDMVFKYQLYGETLTGTIYRQYIPDTEKEFWHFYFSFNYKGQNYVIKDAAMSELNEYQSRKIYNALSSVVNDMTGHKGEV